jgi:hypothetical protein
MTARPPKKNILFSELGVKYPGSLFYLVTTIAESIRLNVA